MPSARPLPPALLPQDGQYLCPLCRQPLDYHTRLGAVAAFSCGYCSAYWCEADVIRHRAGSWDDCGRRCSARRIPNVVLDGPEVLECVLGAEHADDQPEVMHIDAAGHRWLDELPVSSAR